MARGVLKDVVNSSLIAIENSRGRGGGPRVLGDKVQALRLRAGLRRGAQLLDRIHRLVRPGRRAVGTSRRTPPTVAKVTVCNTFLRNFRFH